MFELPYFCIESAPGDVVLGEDGKPIEGAVPPQIGEDGQPIVGAAAGTEAAEAPAPEPEVKETHPCLKLTFFFTFMQTLVIIYGIASKAERSTTTI